MFETSVQEKWSLDPRTVLGSLAAIVIMVISGYLLVAR